jgi:hypothetical protein
MTDMSKPTDKAPLPSPSAAERKAIGESQSRRAKRSPRFSMKIEKAADGSLANVGPPHDDHEGWLSRLEDLFATHGRSFALSQLNSLLQAARGSDGGYDNTKVNAMLAFIEGARPQDELQAVLGVQMAITNELAIQALHRAARVDQIPQYDSAGGMAVRLLRTFVAQAETLAKLQRGGEQVVKVVHVHPGGQAVIGNVQTAGRGGGSDEIGNQPHAPDAEQSTAARSITAERLAAMPCADEERQPVPVPTGTR